MMGLSTNLHSLDLRSTFFTDLRPCSSPITSSFIKLCSISNPRREFPTLSVETSVKEREEDRESLFSTQRNGASLVSSGVKSDVTGNPPVLLLDNIWKSYNGVTVLMDVSWEVKRGEKVGLVGVNGAGKTTLLRIIAGQEEADSGHVIKANPNMKVAFLSQVFEVSMSRTVKEEFMSAFKEEKEMNLDSVDDKVRELMLGLGFAAEDEDRLVASFSGGWQMRMLLGKILAQDSDLLLLDEPTNHLDLETIEWLESYLKELEVPMVIVSHDRAVLDLLCTKIVEIDIGLSRTFGGSYSQYVLSKETWVQRQLKALRLQRGETDSDSVDNDPEEVWLEEDGEIVNPYERKKMKIRFPEPGTSGRLVLTLQNIDFGFQDDKMLFNKANLVVERGEKIAIIGPNGCGKSTLLKLIMGLEKPINGQIILGDYNVLPNYFEQNQAEFLDLDKTVLETVVEAAKDWSSDDVKSLLGRRSFRAEMLHRKVSLLSGGEKARLAFCKFLVTPSTLLIVDEPTNHLDIPCKEMLEEAIKEYQGTVIMVSHDRYFIRQVVNRVIQVKHGGLEDYAGDYNYYLWKDAEARAQEVERKAELKTKRPKPRGIGKGKEKGKRKMSHAEERARKKLKRIELKLPKPLSKAQKKRAKEKHRIQKMQSFRVAKQRSKATKNSKRWN
ncbi:unnamed protein product [Microthlaspi erraticum]|uniref:ABC transporter domain-containing protein n=1 Tax=Microthlaspi erraticum TaxID=1685480 RepID=A0A6D2J1M1_9BRAS|nr:unnamed protein product [Microthlaspi erraticum]